MLEPCPPCRPVEEPLQTVMQKYTDTLSATPWQTNLTTSLLHDIPTFYGWDTTELEDWLSDIEMAADILRESHAHLAEAKPHGLTCTIVHEALQTGKCWDKIRDILCWKLYNGNIQTYTSCFIKIQQRYRNFLAAYVHCFKTEAKSCDFNSHITTIHIFVKGLWDTHGMMAKIYKRIPRPYQRSSN